MNKNQKEALQFALNREKDVLKALEKIYEQALKDIDEKIADLMGRSDADLSNVIYQVEHQKALKTQVQGILEQLQANEFETVSEYLANAYTDGFVGTMYDLHRQDVPLIVPIDQEQVVAAIKHETKLTSGLYKELGHDIKDLSKTIAGEISRGISTGLGYGEIARNIANQAKIPKNRAMNIARTESHRIQCKSALDAQEKAKKKGADIVKQWDATLDGKTRKSHRKLDGQIREIDGYFEVNGHKAKYPGGFGRPEEDCNCRCALLQRAKLALDEEELRALQERARFFELDKEEEFVEFRKKYLKAAESERVRLDVQKKNTGTSYADVTDEFLKKAKPNSHKVEEANGFTYMGASYVIDGKNVKQNNSQRELEVADILENTLGGELHLIPEVNGSYKGVKTPDYLFRGRKYDLKELSSTKDDAIRNAIHKKKDQADNFILDITKNEKTIDELIKQAEDVFSCFNTKFVDTIIIIKENTIIKIIKRE